MLVGPFSPHQLSMPFEYGFGFDEQHDFAHPLLQLPRLQLQMGQLQQLLRMRKMRFRLCLALQHSELLTQERNLEVLFVSGTPDTARIL